MYLRSWRRCRPTATARPFCLACFAGFQELAHAGRIDGHGLLGMKTCLPAATAASKWIGRKPGGVARITRSQSVCEQLLVGIEADELPLLGDIDLRRIVLPVDGAIAACDAIGERIGHRDELHLAAAGVHRLDRRAGAAAAAADQADLDRVAAESVCAAGDLHLAGGNRPARHEQRGIPQKGPSRGAGARNWSVSASLRLQTVV